MTLKTPRNARPDALPDGIVCVDLEYVGRPRLAACYLVIEGDRAAFIDAGVALSAPRALAALAARGLTPEAVAYVIPTHVHLDHAGGAGALMARCPNARLAVHPRGARHMIDPSRLMAGARAVYGAETLRRTTGEATPVAAERVIEAADGEEFSLNGRALRVVYSPGHAYHHLCVWDERSEGLFTGDVFGAAYPELDAPRGPFVFPPTTPIHFDPARWRDSLDRLMALAPQRLYLTHFGAVEGDLAALARDLRGRIDRFAALARRHAGRGAGRAAAIETDLRALLWEEARAHGCALDAQRFWALLEMDIRLNVQGLEAWLESDRV